MTTNRNGLAPVIAAVSMTAMLAACASDSQTGNQKAMAADAKSCAQVRSEIDRLDARGVPSRIEAANQGKKLSAGQRAEVDEYNRLLQQYLGGRCHL